MVELSGEWLIWSLVNGVPAAIGALLFLVYPPFARRFAWNIEHRQSGLFFGVGFLLRAGLFAHIIAASYWGEIQWMVWGNAVFAGVLLGVTLIWGDAFHWRRPIALIWLFLYVEEPVWMVSLVPEARAAAAGSGVSTGEPIQALLQVALWIEAAVMLAAGLYLFLLDRVAEPRWPWRPNRISARIMAGWPLAWAAWAPALALAGNWSASRGGVTLNLVWLGATLVAMFLFRSQFDFSRRATRVYGGVTAALFLLLLIGYLLQVA
jgi:hypothetical protein